MSEPIRILSVEVLPVFRKGLATILGLQQDMLLAGQAGNAVGAGAEFRCHRPDMTLMELRLPDTNGINAMISIRGLLPCDCSGEV